MPSPLRRSSRQHASTTAADREKEVFKEVKTTDAQANRKRRSDPKEGPSPKKERREHSVDGVDKHFSKLTPKNKHDHHNERGKEDTPRLNMDGEKEENQEKSPGKNLMDRLVEIRVGKADSNPILIDQIPNMIPNGQNTGCMAHTENQDTIAAAIKNMMMKPPTEELIAKEAREGETILEVDERELTVKEVIAKRMKNTTMRGLSRDLVKLITKEKDDCFNKMLLKKEQPATSMDSTIQNVAGGGGSPPSMKGGNLKDVLSQFLPGQNSNKDIAQQTVNKDPFVLTPTPFEPTIMWQAVCQLPTDYKGDDKEFNVEGHRYIRLTSILNEEGFTVPVTIPVKLTLPVGGSVIMSLSDGFRSNRILVKRRNLARWVYLVLRDANLLVHKSFLDLVFDYSGTTLSLRGGDDDSTPLSSLPFIPLTPPSDDIINACNGIKMQQGQGGARNTKDYVYTPRGSKPNRNYEPLPALPQQPPLPPQPSTSVGTSISDPDFLRNYINDLGVDVEVKTESASGDLPSEKTNESRVESEGTLTNSRKVLLIADFDAGTPFEALVVKYGIDLEKVRSILRSRVRIIREEALEMKEKKNKVGFIVRRTNYVGLNIMMWKFFKDCRDNGLQLNGKQLKEHAKTIANQLGIKTFKGSEGWLDAFKKRHKIDLKLMTGVPVNYEEDSEGNIVCPMEPDCDDVADACSPSPSGSPSPQGTTENILAQATALVSTKPLDLGQLGIDQDNSKPNFVVGTPSFRSQAIPSPDECQLISSIVKSAATHVPDKEIAAALDTIRCFILSRDPSLMMPFVDLQSKLAVLASGQQRQRPEQEQEQKEEQGHEENQEEDGQRDTDSDRTTEAREDQESQEDENIEITDEDSVSALSTTQENGELTGNGISQSVEDILAALRRGTEDMEVQ